MTASDSEHKRKHDDVRDHISRDEMVRAMMLLSESRENAERIANEMYDDPADGFGIAGDFSSALSSLSDDAAERVRVLLGETEAEARARLADFLARTPHARAG